MKFSPIIVVLVTGFVLHSVCSAQHIKFNDAERTIIRLQDDRRGIDTIAKYLDSKDEKVAWRAAIALANIKDSSSRPTLISHLAKETRPYVIDAICFALGVLGPDGKAANGIIEAMPKNRYSEEMFIALGRSIPKENVPDLDLLLGKALGSTDKKPTAPHAAIIAVSSALVQMGLRKMIDEDGISMCGELDTNDDPVVRWHCAYALARTEDSTLLSRHLDILKVFLKDIGSPEARMFAATALGKIHNEEAGSLLIEAARSEVEWRVQVNIFNAIAKLPRFSSAIDGLIKKAVVESTKDSLTSNHVASTALNTLDDMIAAGKVSSPDSISIREWLAEYQPNHEMHEDQSVRIRSQCMIPFARLGVDREGLKQIFYYVSYHDRTAEINVWKAVGLVPDTLAFYTLLERVFATSASDVVYVLDGIHSLWEIAKKDTSLMNEFEARRFANMYRHMLIRFASLTYEPSILATTMELMKDPLIITDSLRSEADEYLLLYLDKYGYPQYHDQLLSILNTIAWLKPKADTFRVAIHKIIQKASTEWGDQMLVDSASSALSALGEAGITIPTAKLVREPIDWKTIENLPDTMLVSTKYGFMYLKLKIFDAPLTCLNMYKLAKNNFFANNYIHRVVPNFVIQTGDNTGTGEGGPGYSIRTEISPIRYDDEGVVGMASSGKDTEGSQWFITHCPTPHLNTRYTIWGEIVKGRENIDKYLVNDQIVNVTAYK